MVLEFYARRASTPGLAAATWCLHIALARKARFAVALSLIELKRFDGAFRELTALSTSGRAAAVSNALGIVQMRRTAPPDTNPAVIYFARAAAEDPGNPNYLFNLGYAHARSGMRRNVTSLREVSCSTPATRCPTCLMRPDGDRRVAGRTAISSSAVLGTKLDLAGLSPRIASAGLEGRHDWMCRPRKA